MQKLIVYKNFKLLLSVAILLQQVMGVYPHRILGKNAYMKNTEGIVYIILSIRIAKLILSKI